MMMKLVVFVALVSLVACDHPGQDLTVADLDPNGDGILDRVIVLQMPKKCT